MTIVAPPEADDVITVGVPFVVDLSTCLICGDEQNWRGTHYDEKSRNDRSHKGGFTRLMRSLVQDCAANWFIGHKSLHWPRDRKSPPLSCQKASSAARNEASVELLVAI